MAISKKCGNGVDAYADAYAEDTDNEAHYYMMGISDMTSVVQLTMVATRYAPYCW